MLLLREEVLLFTLRSCWRMAGETCWIATSKPAIIRVSRSGRCTPPTFSFLLHIACSSSDLLSKLRCHKIHGSCKLGARQGELACTTKAARFDGAWHVARGMNCFADLNVRVQSSSSSNSKILQSLVDCESTMLAVSSLLVVHYIPNLFITLFDSEPEFKAASWCVCMWDNQSYVQIQSLLLGCWLCSQLLKCQLSKPKSVLQGGVTPIHSVLTPVTGVKILDRLFCALTTSPCPKSCLDPLT